jgi:hypothetical protein
MRRSFIVLVVALTGATACSSSVPAADEGAGESESELAAYVPVIGSISYGETYGPIDGLASKKDGGEKGAEAPSASEPGVVPISSHRLPNGGTSKSSQKYASAYAAQRLARESLPASRASRASIAASAGGVEVSSASAAASIAPSDRSATSVDVSISSEQAEMPAVAVKIAGRNATRRI